MLDETPGRVWVAAGCIAIVALVGLLVVEPNPNRWLVVEVLILAGVGALATTWGWLTLLAVRQRLRAALRQLVLSSCAAADLASIAGVGESTMHALLESWRRHGWVTLYTKEAQPWYELTSAGQARAGKVLRLGKSQPGTGPAER